MMISIFLLQTCAALQENIGLSTNVSKTNQNGIIITKENFNAFFIESEKKINLTFRFDQPLIETNKWTNCAKSNTNLTELSREYGNALIEEWLSLNINNSYHENDFTISNNKVILHKTAKEVQIKQLRLRLPNKNTIDVTKTENIYFKNCQINNNVHYIEAKGDSEFNQILIKTSKIEDPQSIEWNIVNADKVVLPRIIEEQTFTAFIFNLQATKMIVIKIKFWGNFINVNGENKESESCLAFTIKGTKLISNDELGQNNDVNINNKNLDDLFAHERILDKDIFVGSATNFGTTLFKEFGESRSISITQKLFLMTMLEKDRPFKPFKFNHSKLQERERGRERVNTKSYHLNVNLNLNSNSNSNGSSAY